MDDRANVERADGAASRNALGGKARSVAQAQNVYGGVHMYDTSPSRTSSQGSRTTNLLAIFAIVMSLVSLLFALRRITLPVLAGPSAPTSVPPGESGAPSAELAGIAEMEIPPRRDDGRLEYLVALPEIAHAYGFEAYQCAGRMYHKVTVGAVQVSKKSSNIASVARTYGDNFANELWRAEAFSKYGPPLPASRTPYGGSIHHGVQLVGVMPLAADAKCEVDVVMVGVLALDRGDSYWLVMALVGASRQDFRGQRQAAQDVRFILDHIGMD